MDIRLGQDGSSFEFWNRTAAASSMGEQQWQDAIDDVKNAMSNGMVLPTSLWGGGDPKKMKSAGWRV